MSHQLSRRDAYALSARWREVANHLDAARSAWRSLDAHTFGTLDELVQHARLNAVAFHGIGEGLDRGLAWRNAERECGRLPGLASYVRFALTEDLPAGDDTGEEDSDDDEY